MLLNEAWITEHIREEIKKFLVVNEKDDTTSKSLGHYESSTKRKFIAWSAFKKRIKSQQLNDLTLQLKALEKEEQNNTKSSRRKEIIRIRAEIKKLKQKKQFKKLTKQKVGSLRK